MPSRIRGLWWKEWRQLRLLRIVGAALIVVGPLMLLTVAEAARRRWVPLSAMENYSAATVVQDALPMFLGFLIWPLLAMMFAAQSFCGDIATGTESFWMTRPVQPRRVWMTRLLASLTSLFGVISLHWIVWRVLVAIWGNADAFDAVGQHTRWFLMHQFEATASGTAFTAGLVIALAAFLSMLAASVFARSPMQALPLGLIFLALPFGLGQMFSAIFPILMYNHLVDFARPLPLFIVYLFVSYLAFCRGEPAGRGKLLRGLKVLGIGVVAVAALAAPASWWVVQHAEGMALGDSIVVASPAGDRFFFYNPLQGSGWLYDSESGEELLHLSPFVSGAAWNADGDRLALTRFSESGGFLLEVYDRNGTAIVDGVSCDFCGDLHWAGDRLAASQRREGEWLLDWIDPTSGKRTPVEVDEGVQPLELIGPTSDGTSYVARPTELRHETEDGTSVEGPALLLYPLNVDGTQVGTEFPIEGVDHHHRYVSLAPDGSKMLLERTKASVVVDFEEASSLQIGRVAAWLRPNRPVWAERVGEETAILIHEDGNVREFKRFEGHGSVELSSTPDGKRLLLVRYAAVSIPGGVQSLQHWLYDVDTDRWTELQQTKMKTKEGWPVRPGWVNNDTLVLPGAGVLALCEPGVPGSLRFIKGG